MNGIHDLGGMHGLGPIPTEENEPYFHHEWERRVFPLFASLFVGVLYVKAVGEAKDLNSKSDSPRRAARKKSANRCH